MIVIKHAYSTILIISLVISGFYFVYAYHRRKIPGAKNFILMLLSVVIYNATYFLELNSKSFSQALFWYNVEHIVIPVQPYIWLLICLDFAGKFKHKNTIKILGLIHPVVYYLEFFTNKYHHLYDASYRFESNGYFSVLITQKSMLFNVIVVTGTLTGILITMIYLVNCFKNAKIFRYNYYIMIFASLFPWISVYFNQISCNTLKLDYFPFASFVSEFIFLYGIFKFRIMSTIPIAHNMIFQQAKEGIVLLDLNDYIIDTNSKFTKLFPDYKIDSNKNTWASFLSENLNVKTSMEGGGEEPFCLLIDGKNTYYSAEMMDIVVENNTLIGKMIVLHNITSFIENQKRLEFAVSKAVQRAESNETAFLQSQIKPHFLNNTLSLISSMITRDPNQAKEIIVDLSEYLMGCYQFDARTPMIPLQEELDFMDTYIAIEKARFMERLHVKMIFDELPNIKIPRLIIQPLVENAIRHGVLQKAEGGTVEISIAKSRNKVLIEVKDDGIGISKVRISRLLKGIDENQGVGIINIHKRLIKYYGKGLHIKSEINVGTCVSFSIPLLTGDEKGHENDMCNCCR